MYKKNSVDSISITILITGTYKIAKVSAVNYIFKYYSTGFICGIAVFRPKLELPVRKVQELLFEKNVRNFFNTAKKLLVM